MGPDNYHVDTRTLSRFGVVKASTARHKHVNFLDERTSRSFYHPGLTRRYQQLSGANFQELGAHASNEGVDSSESDPLEDIHRTLSRPEPLAPAHVDQPAGQAGGEATSNEAGATTSPANPTIIPEGQIDNGHTVVVGQPMHPLARAAFAALFRRHEASADSGSKWSSCSLFGSAPSTASLMEPSSEGSDDDSDDSTGYHARNGNSSKRHNPDMRRKRPNGHRPK